MTTEEADLFKRLIRERHTVMTDWIIIEWEKLLNEINREPDAIVEKTEQPA